MSYLARLKGEFSETPLPSELTKPTKAPSVSFVSAPSRQIPETDAANHALNMPQDTAAEVRRQRVLAVLRASPSINYAVVTDVESNPDSVIVALAIRGRATCELLIPRDRYDGILLLELIERHGTTVH